MFKLQYLGSLGYRELTRGYCILNRGITGKGLVKKLRCSPDAFIQMTLQLTYFRVRFTVFGYPALFILSNDRYSPLSKLEMFHAHVGTRCYTFFSMFGNHIPESNEPQWQYP